MQEVWRIVLPCPGGSSLPGTAATGRRGTEAHAAVSNTPLATSVQIGQAIGLFDKCLVDVGVERARDDTPAAFHLNKDPIIARLGKSVGEGNSRRQAVARMRV